MASLSKRRTPERARAEHELEKTLDQMHATKADRVLARKVFREQVDKAKPVTLRTAIKRSVQAVDDARKEPVGLPDATPVPA